MIDLRTVAPAVVVVLAGLAVYAGGLPGVWVLAGFVAAGILINLWVRSSERALPDDDRTRAPAPSAQVAAQRTGNTAPRGIAAWPAMLDGIPDPALVLDEHGRLLRSNAAAAALFPGGSGRHVSIANRSPELLAAVEQAFATGTPQPFEARSAVPVERTLMGLATPLWGRDKAPAFEPAMLIVIRDQTVERQLAQMRADFVANASHELRTPLSSLKGFVETLQGAAKDDPIARDKFLGIMQMQATRMSRLIEDLLSLSRIEMREHVPPTGRVDLAAVVTEVVAALRPLGEAAGITILVAGAGQTVTVAGDRDELAQVAQNLVQNAIKYGKPGGRIDIGLRETPGRLFLSVKDDGIGIAPEHLPRLTERFYRVNARDSRERGGTGLGLAIVKHIVNRHNGELQILSQAGAGSTFTVSLPKPR